DAGALRGERGGARRPRARRGARARAALPDRRRRSARSRAAPQGAAHGLERGGGARSLARARVVLLRALVLLRARGRVARRRDRGARPRAVLRGDRARRPARRAVPPREEPARGRGAARALRGGPMELIPAIDLLDGRVVRLHQGDYGAATAYASDPVAQARAFAEAGAERVHVVDLEGARSGAPAHAAVVEAILRSVPIAVQVGGGIRTREAALRWLEAGAERVVLGTVAVRDPDLSLSLCAEHPGR